MFVLAICCAAAGTLAPLDYHIATAGHQPLSAVQTQRSAFGPPPYLYTHKKKKKKKTSLNASTKMLLSQLFEMFTISVGQHRSWVDTNYDLPVSCQSDLTTHIFIQHHCHRLNTRLLLGTHTHTNILYTLTGRRQASGFFYRPGMYLIATVPLHRCYTAA